MGDDHHTGNDNKQPKSEYRHGRGTSKSIAIKNRKHRKMTAHQFNRIPYIGTAGKGTEFKDEKALQAARPK
jgi:hypothetical protein